MSDDSAAYLIELQQNLIEHFNWSEIEDLCLHLNVDHEIAPGTEKSRWLRGLLIVLGRDGRLPELVALVQEERPKVAWSPVPDDFDMPASLDEEMVWDGRIPYLGLKAYQESDAEFFFGRGDLVDDLLERIEKSRFVVIAGPSGSGKSSVARAGLFYALRQGRVEGSDKWLLATMTPRGEPIEQLATAVSRLAGTPDAGDFIRREGSGNSLALQQQVEAIERMGDNPHQRLVLLVDQFEEVFTQTKIKDEDKDTDKDKRAAFINLLTTAAKVENGRTIVILALRSDFVSNCAKYQELRALMSKEFQLVGAMAPRDLAKAITLPSLEVGAEIEPALVKQIIDDMEGEPGALPLMSFALRDLFEAEITKQGERMDLKLQEYLERGGVENALERHADNVFESFTEEEQELAKSIFAKLITVGEGRVDTSRTASFEELVPAGVDAAAVATVVGMLAAEDVRLVTTSGMEGNEGLTAEKIGAAQTTVTIAHEKLIDAWPWLRGLVDENREIIAIQNRITNDARDWAKDEDVGFLYSGGRLLNVEEQLQTIQPNLDALSLRFIEASINEKRRRAEQEEANRKREEDLHGQKRVGRILRWSTAIVGVLLLVAIFLAFQSYNNANRAEHARSISDANAELAASREAEALAAEAVARDALDEIADLKNRIQASQLAMASDVELEKDQELALLLATAGLGLSPQPDTLARFNSASFSPFRHSLEGHEDVVNSAVFSPDGRHIVTTSSDGSARVWDLAGNEVAALKGHEGKVNSAVFNPDGGKIVTAGCDKFGENRCLIGSAKVWDLEGEELAALEEHEGEVNSAIFSPDGQTIVTSTYGSARVWDTEGNELASLDGHTDWVWSASFSPDGGNIVTASSDGSAKVWDLEGKELASLDRHWDRVNSAVFSPDGGKIVTASTYGSAKVWDLEGNELASLGWHRGGVNSVAFSPDGQTIVTASTYGSAKVWDLAGNELASLDGHETGINSAVFSPDGGKIVTAGCDEFRENRCLVGSAKVWDLEGNELAALKRHEGEVNSAVFSPDGGKIVTAGCDEFRENRCLVGSAKVWDMTCNELVSIDGHETGINSAVFSPDGQTIVTASTDGSAKVWDLEGNELASLRGHLGWVLSVSFSPDGQQIVTASEDGTAKLWDLSGNELVSIDEHGRDFLVWLDVISKNEWDLEVSEQHVLKRDERRLWITSAVFSPDGQTIVTASDGRSKVRDLEGNELASLDGHISLFNSAVFSPDGQTIVTSTYGGAKVWDLEGNELASLDGHRGGVNSAAFSPDGQTIVTSTYSSAKVWDLEGNELASLEGHEGGVNSVVFSPDGTLIVTASDDGSARVWDLAGNELASLEGHEGGVNSASFRPDGTLVVTASDDGSARVWEIYPSIAEKVAVAQARLSEAFSDEQCRRFFRNDPESCPQELDQLFALFEDDLQRP